MVETGSRVGAEYIVTKPEGRILLQFSSQTGDYTLYCIVRYTDFFFPYMGINLLFSKHPSGVLRQ